MTLRATVAISVAASIFALAFLLAVSVSERAHGSGIVVTNINNAGPGSLRQAIMDANANAGHDVITFHPLAFPEDAPPVIIPATALPGMDDPAGTAVDGTGAGVVIDGSSLVGNESGLVFHTMVGVDLMDVTVRSLTVRNFPDHGVHVCPGDPAVSCIVEDSSNILLDDVTVSGNGSHGIAIDGDSVNNATVTNSTAVSNGFHGLEINSCGGAAMGSEITNNTMILNNHTGARINACDNVFDAVVSGNTLSTNVRRGLEINAADHAANVTITNNLASNNGDFGIVALGSDSLVDLLVTGNTTNGHGDDGLVIRSPNGTLDEAVLTGNLAQFNQSDGIHLQAVDGGSESANVTGNILCGNSESGLHNENPIEVDARGNWWGHALGPSGPGDDVIGNGANNVNFSSWIDTITASADVAVLAMPGEVRFQFSDAFQTVFLGEGLSATNPFTLTTDNGTLTSAVESGASVDAFINEPDGTLSVTLTPNAAGTATVAITGPCGLDGTLGGNSIEVEVLSEPPTPTPTGSPTPTPTPTPTGTPSPTPTAEPEGLQGDVDCDGDVDAVDALKILQFIAGVPFEQEPGCPEIGEQFGDQLFGDVDCDGDVDAVDALKILQFIAAIPFGQMEPCVDIGQPLG